MQYASKYLRSVKMDSGTRRITNTWLIEEADPSVEETSCYIAMDLCQIALVTRT